MKVLFMFIHFANTRHYTSQVPDITETLVFEIRTKHPPKKVCFCEIFDWSTLYLICIRYWEFQIKTKTKPRPNLQSLKIMIFHFKTCPKTHNLWRTTKPSMDH